MRSYEMCTSSSGALISFIPLLEAPKIKSRLGSTSWKYVLETKRQTARLCAKGWEWAWSMLFGHFASEGVNCEAVAGGSGGLGGGGGGEGVESGGEVLAGGGVGFVGGGGGIVESRGGLSPGSSGSSSARDDERARPGGVDVDGNAGGVAGGVAGGGGGGEGGGGGCGPSVVFLEDDMIVSKNIMSVISDLPVKPPPDVLGRAVYSQEHVFAQLKA